MTMNGMPSGVLPVTRPWTTIAPRTIEPVSSGAVRRHASGSDTARISGTVSHLAPATLVPICPLPAKTWIATPMATRPAIAASRRLTRQNVRRADPRRNGPQGGLRFIPEDERVRSRGRRQGRWPDLASAHEINTRPGPAVRPGVSAGRTPTQERCPRADRRHRRPPRALVLVHAAAADRLDPARAGPP